MISDDRIEIVRILTEEFHLKIKPTFKSAEDYQLKGEAWLKDVKLRFNDDKINVQATKILLIASNRQLKLVSLSNSSKTNSHKEWNALIMKGGGIKGIAYIGALDELLKYYTFNWYAGTSAGAIAAALLSVGYENTELEKILGDKDFNDFKDARFFRKFYNLLTKSGFYTANEFTVWMDNLLASKLQKKTAVKFNDLPNRLSIYASRKDKRALVFDSQNPSSDKQRVAYAARCSMSIPIIFTPEKSEGLKVFDGGVQNNFPLNQLLTDNPGTKFIGLYLGPEIYEGERKTSIFSNLLSIWTESNDVEALEEYGDDIVVIDPRPISTLKFNLNKEEKDFLIEAGRLSAINFLDKNNLIKKKPSDYENRRQSLSETRTALKKKYKRKKLFKIASFLLIICAIYGVYVFWI